MYDLEESRTKLLSTLDKDKRDKYFQLIRSWVLFKCPISMIQLNQNVSEILHTEEELRAHNQFLFAAMSVKRGTYLKVMPQTEKPFKYVDPIDYVDQPSSSSNNNCNNQHAQNGQNLSNTTERSAVSEYFFPDIGFVMTRIQIQAWENGLDGCEKNVAEYIAHCCQVFIKNILTAMISKKESYKIRDKHFQYGFGMPAPNLLLRNSNKVRDRTKESKVDLNEEEDSFQPSSKPSMDVIEQETAFSYACGSRSYSGGKLTAQLLYDTLRDNPHIVGLHSIHSTNLLKLGLQLED